MHGEPEKLSPIHPIHHKAPFLSSSVSVYMLPSPSILENIRNYKKRGFKVNAFSEIVITQFHIRKLEFLLYCTIKMVVLENQILFWFLYAFPLPKTSCGHLSEFFVLFCLAVLRIQPRVTCCVQPISSSLCPIC